MEFDEVLAQAVDLLRREKRVSYRALKRRFSLDDEYLEDLKDEIIKAKKLAADEDGSVLVWTGQTEPTSEPAPVKDDERPPLSYTPKHLTDKILTTRSSIEGERKLVTVLFADVANFTSISEKLDPEEVHQIMDGCFKILMDEIHRYEGTINQFTGDGVMALFGAPLSHEDHAQRACHAALSIQKTIGGYGEKIQREQGVDFQMRIGLNSGPVIVGSIGDDLRMDYTAVGDTTNLASRMESTAGPGSILVSGNTYRMTRDYFTFEPLGEVQVKGRTELQEAFELLGRSEVETRMEAATVKGLTRFVGRKNSMAALGEAYDQARSGSGQIVGIVGEAGVGKSRLLLEFRNQLNQAEFTYLEGRCLHYGGTMPYLPVLDILRSYFDIEEGEGEFAARKKIEEKILGLDEALRPTLPPFEDLLSLSVQDEAYQKLEPKEKRDRAFEAIRDLLIRESQDRPLLAAMEDLHWIDNTSEELLDYLSGWLANARILLVLLYRPEYTHSWGSKSYYNRIGLSQLTTESSAELIRAILEGGEIAPELRELILNRTAGNPLFVEELTHTLLENGSIQKHDDGYVLSQRDSDIAVPGTIEGIISARIDRLEENLKRTMQVASVIGRDFAFRILQTISGMREELKSNLVNLQRLEFIYEKQLFPELEYIFKHALTQEVAYNSLLRKKRSEIHERIGTAIEQIYADRLEEFCEMLTYHYARGERKEKAIEYALRTGDQAARMYANAEATTYYVQALTMARALPASVKAERWQIDASLKLAAVGITGQDIERDRANLEQAQPLAETLHDEPRLARVLYWLGRLHYVLFNPQIAIEYAEQSLEIADRLGDEALAAPPVNLMGRLYWAQSDYPRASQMAERSVEQMRRVGNQTEESTGSGFAAYVLGMMGEFERALPHANHGVRLAQEIQNPFAEANAYHFRGCVWDQHGEWAQAIVDYEEGRKIADRAGDLFRVHLIKLWEGRAHAMNGDPSRGRMVLEEGLALAEQIGAKFGLAGIKTFLADCLLRLGEFNAALSVCEEGIHLSEGVGERFNLAIARRALGEIVACLEPSDPQGAERALLEAIHIQHEIGAKPELARSCLSYANWLAEKGERGKAKEYVAQARGLFQKMGMAWDLAQAEQVVRRLRD
jgi:class 3 adenylate cyclase/tetratricopeptide (TPR) repeat protein